MTNKDDLIRELTKERDDALAFAAKLEGEQAARIKAEAEIARLREALERERPTF